MTSRACPCGSERPYAECCAPYHRGEREAPDATALMRSRFAAFAMKDVDYLWRTLHPDHDDRARPEADMMRVLREASSANRYLGLRILDAREPDAAGVARVLFAAKVFHRGSDKSFIECSEFARDGANGGWRYVGGEGVACAFASVPAALTIDAFLGRG